MKLLARTARVSSTGLLILGAITALGPISIDLYLPAFGLINRELGAGVEHTLASYLFGVAIGQLFYGPMSDHFGRKPPLYVALCLYILGSVASALSGTMQWLVLGRFVQALGGCAGIVIARAIVRDCCESHEAAHVFSTLIMITAIGPIVAPLIGSYIATLGNWRMLFYAQAAFGVCVLLAVYGILKETHTPEGPREMSISNAMQTYLSLLRNRDFVCCALIGAFAIGSIFSYIASSPTVLMRTFSVTPQQLAILMGVGGLTFVVAARVNVRRLRTHSPAQVLKIAVWIPVLLTAGLVAQDLHRGVSLPMLVAFQLAIFAAIANIGPNVSALALAAQGHRAGAASALLGSIQSLGSTLAGAASGLFMSGGVRSMSLIMLFSATGALVSYRLLLRKPGKSALA